MDAQAQADAAAAAAAAAALALANTAANQGGQPVFALTPALVTQQFLNYALTTDTKLYYKSIAPLTEKFDLTSANMRGFLQAFSDKATDSNWQMAKYLNAS